MFPKISLTAAFILMVAPPMAGASMRTQQYLATASVTAPARGVVVAQEEQQSDNDANSENDNDNDSNDNENENQNGDNGQAQNQNADVGQPVPSQTFDAPEVEPDEAIRVPPLRGFSAQMNNN
jgi:hypothetical protein